MLIDSFDKRYTIMIIMKYKATGEFARMGFEPARRIGKVNPNSQINILLMTKSRRRHILVRPARDIHSFPKYEYVKRKKNEQDVCNHF